MPEHDPPADAPPPTEMELLVATLRESVARYARRQRERGVSVERVIPAVRHLVRDAERAAGHTDDLGLLDGQVVRWALDAYLDEPALRHVPRFY